MSNLSKLIAAVAVIAAFVIGFFKVSFEPNTIPVWSGTQAEEMKKTEQNQKRLLASTPIPSLDKSLERENLAKRLKMLNDENKIMFIYLMSDTGQIVMQDDVKGKVSSLNSLLTTPQQLINKNGDFCDTNWSSNSSCYTVDSPDIDGSYGKNPDGIFWFNSSGAYREWTGKYVVSDQPFNISTPISLVKNK
jgi:hypothetical protein